MNELVAVDDRPQMEKQESGKIDRTSKNEKGNKLKRVMISHT